MSANPILSAVSSAASYSSPSNVRLEVCIDSVSSAISSFHGGAHRVELCSALLEGGLTPSIGLVQEVAKTLNSLRVTSSHVSSSISSISSVAGYSTSLAVLIRPRSGDFHYSAAELAVMRADIRACAAIDGVEGVVIGALTVDGKVDVNATKTLIAAAHSAGNSHQLAVCFHRAIDMSQNIEEAYRTLAEMGGIDRVLSSGGFADMWSGRSVLQSICRLSAQLRGPAVMCGGGLSAAMLQDFLSALSLQADENVWIHGSLRKKVMGPMQFLKKELYMGGEKKNDGITVEYGRAEADPLLVREILQLSTQWENKRRQREENLRPCLTHTDSAKAESAPTK